MLTLECKKVLLVKYGEISLRKGNRAIFEYQIIDTIKSRLEGLGNIRVKREQGRFLIEDVDGDLDVKTVYERIKHIFGITGFSPCVMTTVREMDKLYTIALEYYRDVALKASTFKVHTKRSDKTFPLLSGQVSALIGEYILNATPGLNVDLHNPEVTLMVEIRNHVYFYIDSYLGAGGLPYKSSGKGVLLLSGGLDSPIAGFLSARRGIELFPIYFHSPPFVSERAADKVRDLAKVIGQYTGSIDVNIIPFTDVQLFLKDNVPEAKLTIMLKRAMLRIATAYANNLKALCVITGDSVGQVASQTMHSIAAVNSAADITILRPLAAMDKQQIIDIAREIGTYPISTRPFDDCCTVFVAKHPENKPHVGVIEKIEKKLNPDLEPLLDYALENGFLWKSNEA